ncbi:MAG TPA: hypothetical protein EYN91_16860 [Candidatus Melainabacteria bacterium]|nr:hypothetical protein [Candidatus Melainabacteria bacterium]HIN64670.1 hypothetical protein [Candidatus Obscuribacterales bacterium]
MPDPIEVARPAAPNPAQNEAFKKFLLEMQDDRKLGLGAPRKGFDGFENFRALDFRQDRSDEYYAYTEEISWLQSRRSQGEAKLKPEERDELRHIRRNYSAASTEADREKCRQAMEKLMPGTAELSGKIGKLVKALDSIPTMKEIPDPQKCMRCHPRQGPTHFDPNARERETLKASAVESFYQPRPEDQFEAVWAKNALESPIVKINEVLKHLPPTKIESQDPVKLVKMGLTMSGVELDHTAAKLVEKAVAGIKNISKVSGDRLVIDRDGTVDLPFTDKRDVAAGIKLSSIEVGAISVTLGEGKYPELKDIKGIKVKLNVPAYLSTLAQISNEVEVKRIFFTRNAGSDDFQVNVEVTNPVPAVSRAILKQTVSGAPSGPTIVVPIITLGKDGNPK